MNIIRLGLFFSGVTGWMLTLVWFIMWLVGPISGYVPLFSLILSVALTFTFFATFLLEPYERKDDR